MKTSKKRSKSSSGLSASKTPLEQHTRLLDVDAMMREHSPGTDRQALYREAQATMARHDLAELRRMRGMTQKQVARAMGNTQPAISQAEKAPEASLVHIQRYAKALGLTVEVNFFSGNKLVKKWAR